MAIARQRTTMKATVRGRRRRVRASAACQAEAGASMSGSAGASISDDCGAGERDEAERAPEHEPAHEAVSGGHRQRDLEAGAPRRMEHELDAAGVAQHEDDR